MNHFNPTFKVDDLTIFRAFQINKTKIISLLKEAIGKRKWSLDTLTSSAFSEKTDLFINEFEQSFPMFVKELNSILPNLSPIDLKVCYLMRLDFSTKEIALVTNSSVRAIESRKYRIRKKLGISPELHLNLFLIKLTQE